MDDSGGYEMTGRDRIYFAGLLAVLAVLFTAVTCLSCASMRPMVGRTATDQHRAAVTMRLTCANGAGGGSGALISGGRVVTAAHVVLCELLPGIYYHGTVQVNPGDDKWRDAEILMADPESDVAVVRVPELDNYYTHVEIGPKPEIGDTVCMASGSIPYYMFKCGLVQPGPADEIVVGIVVIPGNSGSGMYDARGRLVGIVKQFKTCSTLRWMQACDGIAAPLWPMRDALGLQ